MRIEMAALETIIKQNTTASISSIIEISTDLFLIPIYIDIIWKEDNIFWLNWARLENFHIYSLAEWLIDLFGVWILRLKEKKTW